MTAIRTFLTILNFLFKLNGTVTGDRTAGCFEQLAEDLRAVLRMAAGRKAEPSAAILDSRTLRATPESGERAGYDGAKRKQGSKLHMAVDTLGHLLALHVTPANADDRAQVTHLAKAVQAATDDSVEWPAAGFTDTRFRCDGEAGGAPCSVASSGVSSRSRRFDWFGNVVSVWRRPRAISMFTKRCCTGG